MAETKLLPLTHDVKIVDPDNGFPDPYFIQWLQQLREEKGITDDLAEEAIQPADLTAALLALELDDLADVDTSTIPPTDGQALVWDAANSEWIAGDVATSGSLPYKGALVTKLADQLTANYNASPIMTWDKETRDTHNIHGLSSVVTITIATPGVVTWTGHNFENGSPIVLTTTGALPTGLVAGTTYYVVNKAANTFQLAATTGGAAINTTGVQSGVHTGANYSRLTVPPNVTKVRLRAQVSMLLVTSGVTEVIAITKNASAAYSGYATDRSDIANTDPAVSCETPVIDVVQGDYFEVPFTVTTDNSITVQADRSWFAMDIVEENIPNTVSIPYEAGPAGTFPSVVSLTWLNQGTSTAFNLARGLLLNPQVNALPHSLVKAVPAAPFSLYGRFDHFMRSSAAAATTLDNAWGIVLRNSVNNRISTFQIGYQRTATSILQPNLVINRWTADGGAYSATPYFQVADNNPLWIRLDVTATTVTFFIGNNGVDWIQLTTETIATFLAGLTHWGIFSYAAANATAFSVTAPYLSDVAPA